MYINEVTNTTNFYIKKSLKRFTPAGFEPMTVCSCDATDPRRQGILPFGES
jgi:hypothetical protein